MNVRKLCRRGFSFEATAAGESRVAICTGGQASKVSRDKSQLQKPQPTYFEGCSKGILAQKGLNQRSVELARGEFRFVVEQIAGEAPGCCP